MASTARGPRIAALGLGLIVFVTLLAGLWYRYEGIIQISEMFAILGSVLASLAIVAVTYGLLDVNEKLTDLEQNRQRADFLTYALPSEIPDVENLDPGESIEFSVVNVGGLDASIFAARIEGVWAEEREWGSSNAQNLENVRRVSYEDEKNLVVRSGEKVRLSADVPEDRMIEVLDEAQEVWVHVSPVLGSPGKFRLDEYELDARVLDLQLRGSHIEEDVRSGM